MSLAIIPALSALSLPWTYVWAVAQIGLLDLLLAGDNAVVIALAARRLPPHRRRAGLITGAVAAVLLRVALTFAASGLLAWPGLRLVGGGFILWLAFTFPRAGARDGTPAGEPGRFWPAVRLILWADLVMSLDNVIAVAGAAHGDFGLLVFGLALSIPLVVGASNLLARLMDRRPFLLALGAALLGKVGAGMILTDPAVTAWPAPNPGIRVAVEAATALGVLIWTLRRRPKSERLKTAPGPSQPPAG